MKKYLDRGLIVIMGLLIIGALLGSAYFAFSIPKTEITFITYEGITYQCEHYSNGDMNCRDVDDPDVVGGGKDTE